MASLISLLPRHSSSGSSVTYPAAAQTYVSQNAIAYSNSIVGYNGCIPENERTYWRYDIPSIHSNHNDEYGYADGDGDRSNDNPQICSLTTSQDGRMVTAAAVTNDGGCIVVLLDATNGRVVFTRTLRSSETKDDLEYNCEGADVRYVLSLEEEEEEEEEGDVRWHGLIILTRSKVKTNVYLVEYQIDSRDYGPQQRTRIVPQSMSMEVLDLQRILEVDRKEKDGGNYVQCLRACKYNHSDDSTKQIVRMFVRSNQGDNLSVIDYECTTKALHLVRPVLCNDGSVIHCPSKVGTSNSDTSYAFTTSCIEIDACDKEKPMVVFMVKSKSNVVLFQWYLVKSLELVGCFSISHLLKDTAANAKSKQSRIPTVLDFCPIRSFDSNLCISVAIVIRKSIKILQLLRGDDYNLSQPHVVCNVPISKSLKAIALTAAHFSISYDFVFSTIEKDSKTRLPIWQRFTINDDALPVGKFTYLLANNRFDEADRLLESTDSFTHNSPLASMHGSLVALSSLSEVISNRSEDAVTKKLKVQQAKDALRRLATGAVSSGYNGTQCLMRAANMIVTWNDISTEESVPSVTEYKLALTSMKSVLTNVISAMTKDNTATTQFSAASKRIDDKLLVLGVFEDISKQSKPKMSLWAIECNSIEEIYAYFVTKGQLDLAEHLRLSQWGLRANSITPETVVNAFLNIANEILLSNAQDICAWLRNFLIPSIHCCDKNTLRVIRSWGCKIADSFDISGHAEIGILFLESITDAMAFTSNRTLLHPVDVIRPSNRYFEASDVLTVDEGHISHLDTSGDSLSVDNDSKKNVSNKRNPRMKQSWNPCLLQLEGVESTPYRPSNSKVLASSTHDDEDDCDEKLIQAYLLQDARKFCEKLPNCNLPMFTLHNFASMGGADTLSIELLRQICEGSKVPSLSKEIDVFDSFCSEHNVNFDGIVDKYTTRLSSGRGGSNYQTLCQIALLAEKCRSEKAKVAIGLKALQNSLLSTKVPNDIQALAESILIWARNHLDLLPQAEEAVRLLKVNEILRRYCGNASINFFRVAEPEHSRRLLAHVCRSIYEKRLLTDALALCEAFTHLSKVDAAYMIIQNIIVAEVSDSSDSIRDRCFIIFTKMYEENEIFGNDIIHRLIIFVDESISDCKFLSSDSTKEKIRVSSVCKLLCSLLSYIINEQVHEGISWLLQYGFHSLKSLLNRIRRRILLQREFDIFLPLTSHNPGWMFIENVHEVVFEPIISFTKRCACSNDEFLEGSSNFLQLRSLISKGKRAFNFIYGEGVISTHEWFKAINNALPKILDGSSEKGRIICIEILHMSGVLSQYEDVDTQRLAASILISISKSFCSIGGAVAKNASTLQNEDLIASMKCVIQSRVLLQEYGLINFSDGESISRVLDLHGLSEFISDLLIRADGSIGEEVDSFLRKLRQFVRERRMDRESCKTMTYTQSILDSSVARFHSSWYVGDGLLLPPLETLKYSLQFSVAMLQRSTASIPTGFCHDIVKFLVNRGAHNLALRANLLMISAQTFDINVEHIITPMAERSLGTSGSGIVSGTVDSQCAVVYLLGLSKKKAFKVFGAALPIAINKRDFERLITLARLGVCLGGASSQSFLPKEIGWPDQISFMKQCEDLEECSKWWRLLKSYGVIFEPTKFGVDSSEKKSRVEYASYVMPFFVKCAADKLREPKAVLKLMQSFGNFFGCDPHLAPQKHSEYFLSWPSSNVLDIELCHSACKVSLSLLPSPIARSAVLRRIIISLESHFDDACGKDYERHSRLLSLYKSAFITVISERQNRNSSFTGSSESKVFDDEMIRVDRRLDVLAILISAFDQKNLCIRPNYSKLFLPFPSPFGTKENHDISMSGVIENIEDNSFDPISQMRSIFVMDRGDALVQALAAINYPLGLPSGFVQARYLQALFKKSKAQGLPLPSVDFSIGTIKKLKIPRDGVALSLWCAKMYRFTSSEGLKCLERAHSLALLASSEAESRRLQSDPSHENYDELLKEEKLALEQLKSINQHLALLTDLCKVEEVLFDFSSTIGKISDSVKHVLQDVIDKLREKFSNGKSEENRPEKYVEYLFTESSLLAFNAIVSNSISTIEQLQMISSRVHSAILSLDQKYSHIHAAEISRNVARRWLLHGDDVNVKEVGEKRKMIESSLFNQSIDEETDTVNFIMDLKVLAKSQALGEDIGTISTDKKDTFVASQEEPFSVSALGSGRDRSERSISRCALRTAFVMSFVKGYRRTYKSNSEDTENEVNMFSASSKDMKVSKSFSRAKDSQVMSLKELAKDLLNIVFSKSNVSSKGMHPSNRLPLSPRRRTESMKTITYSMRNRSLKTVLILCPMSIIEAVIDEENYLEAEACDLERCSYGLFVATEVEEMGLSLPHSDLLHLSAMDGSSYARALWRDHGNTSYNRHSGRLYLLLLNLCTYDGRPTNIDLILTLLGKLCRDEYKRSILRALESVSLSKPGKDHKKLIVSAIYSRDESILLKCFWKTTNTVCEEILNEFDKDKLFEESIEALSLLGRLKATGYLLYRFGALPSKDLYEYKRRLMDMSDTFHSSKCNRNFIASLNKISAAIRLKEGSY